MRKMSRKQDFASVARRYDIANRVLSFGLDTGWRRKAVSLCGIKGGERVLDICCGTGDLAFTFYRAGARNIYGSDICTEMLAYAKQKATKVGSDAKFEWFEGNCEYLDFEDESFDIVSCGFGIRNVSDVAKAAGEMHRVLKNGGRVCILEFSEPGNRLLRIFHRGYLRCILPLCGGIITGQYASYRYLSESIFNWVETVDMAEVLRDAGFGEIRVLKLSCGITTVYIAEK